jgi:hypothetical protein
MKPFRITSVLGLLIVLFSSTLPWLTINLVLAQSNLTLLQFYDLIRGASNLSSQLGANAGSEVQTLNQNVPGVAGLELTIILYPLTVIMALIAIGSRKAAGAAGIFGMLTGGAWIFGIESLKQQISQSASSAGLFGQFAANTVNNAFDAGTGTYVMIFGGLILFIGLFLKGQQKTPKSYLPNPATYRMSPQNNPQMQQAPPPNQIHTSHLDRPLPPPISPVTDVYCPNCGNQCSSIQNYCKNCGSSLK